MTLFFFFRYSYGTTMNNDTSTIPLYIRLFERNGKPTETLVARVKELAEQTGTTDDVSLENISVRDDNPSQNIITYRVSTKPSRQRHSASIGSFLDSVFSQLFENNPAYCPPLKNVKKHSDHKMNETGTVVVDDLDNKGGELR